MSRLCPPALLLFIASLIATPVASSATYYIAANGSDSNSGTSKTAPWAHAPGMPNCAGTCASTTPKAGDQFIFRGGDSWHFGNNAAVPYVGGTWLWQWAGSNGSPIYIGVDKTWFSGAWVRPVMTGDNPISSSFVSSCSYDNGASLPQGFFKTAASVSYVTLDNFDWTGRCWAGTGFDEGQIYLANSPTYFTFSNNYCHGWTTVDTSSDGYSCILGSGIGQADHVQIVGNVFDGSDSSRATAGSSHCKWVNFPSSPCQSGQLIYQAAYDVHNNVFRYSSNMMVVTNNVTNHDNLYEYLYPSYQNNGPHPNVMNQDANVEGVDTSFYNNIVRHTYVSEMFFLTVPNGHSLHFFNNVFFDNSNYVSGTAPTNCLLMESTQNLGSTAYFYNNTFDWTTGGCMVNGSGTNLNPYSTNWSGTMYFENNHFIGYDASHNPPSIANGVTHCSSGATCTFTDNGTEVFQTEAVANGQGYVAGNNYAPTSNSNATVGAGTNLASACSLFSSDSALCSGTSGGVLEQSGGGGQIASYPAIAIVPRPSTWDAGAYQFSGGTQPPNPPTGLTTVVH